MDSLPGGCVPGVLGSPTLVVEELHLKLPALPLLGFRRQMSDEVPPSVRHQLHLTGGNLRFVLPAQRFAGLLLVGALHLLVRSVQQGA